METTEITRNESYYKTEKPTRHKQILDAFKVIGDFTNRGLSIYLGLSINQITGRVKELRDQGLVEVKGKIYDEVTKRTVIVFGLATKQLELF